MRVFVTGGTGFIGSAVIAELLAAGHDVLGLARSAESADALRAAGAAVHRGELDDPETLAAAARSCDGVAHLAFIHDFARYHENGEIDRRVVDAMVHALDGTGKPLVITSGITVAAPGRAVTEDDAATSDSPSAVRTPSEAIMIAAAGRGVRSSIVRLPPTVHGRGDRAFVPALVDIARRAGSAAYVADGTNRWSAVHRLDAARLFRLALESAPPGTRLHGVAEEGIPMREIAETIGLGLGVPVQRIDAAAAPEHFGWLAHFVALDASATSTVTQQSMNWRPREMALLEDMRSSGYLD